MIRCLLTLLCSSQSHIVSLEIILYEVLPKSLLGNLCNLFAALIDLFVRKPCKVTNIFCNYIGCIEIVAVGTRDNLYTIKQFATTTKHLVHPKAKACKVGGDGWDVERCALERSVAPRLVV